MEIIEQSHEIMTPIDETGIYMMLERAGRTAYKSEDKINAGSAEKFIAKILASGHESVIEHFNLTVKFITDRGVTHELVRHRLVSYTQESTRYCNYTKKGMTVIKPVFWEECPKVYSIWLGSMINAECTYNQLITLGCSPQQARTVLPNSLKTEIVCTANIREWRHILKLRTSANAHPQIRELMKPLLIELQNELPVLFGDIYPEA